MSLMTAELTFYSSNNPHVVYTTEVDGDDVMELLVPKEGADEDALAWQEAHSKLNQRTETAAEREQFELWLKGGEACVALADETRCSVDSSGFGDLTGVHPVNM